jgi:hypothetical protein
MVDDIVARLRCYADIDDAVYHPWVYAEAADRIEKLEAALRKIAEECQNTGYGNPIVMERMIDRIEETARAALGEASDD